MNPIRMVDLHGQYMHIKSEVDAGIQHVIDNTAFINGPETKSFAQDLATYNSVKHAITCGNGTDALQIAMMGLELKPGDEVIVPTFTYVATVEVIALLDLQPVFVDVDPDTFNMDAEDFRAKISKKTKAVVPVHLFGQCADMEPILKIAGEHGIHVIEDAAQSIGAEYTFSDGTTQKAGTMGMVGTTSFFPSKNLGCFGDGGALLTNDDALAKELRMIANHGQKHKYHYDRVGVNSRLDTIQAAILQVKLKHLPEYNRHRQEAARYYDKALQEVPNIQIPSRVSNSTHVYNQYTIKLTGISRDEFQNALKAEGIPSQVYYPVPLHLQKAYQPYGYKKGDFQVAEALGDQVMSLPMHTEMEEEQLAFITEKIKALSQVNLQS